MTATLSDVSMKLAATLLSEVQFEDRLTGRRMRQMSDGEQTFIYGLQEAVDFMKAPELGRLLSPGAGGTIGYLDFAELTRWIGEVFGDHELAQAIDDAQATAASPVEGLAVARTLIGQRLNQCREMLGGAC